MKTSKINAAWHRAHKMPKNPTEKQRLAWHIGHARHCSCWPVPKKLLTLVRAKSR